ncbi:DUF2808 domain-containing protein [Synechococcus sp. PCC 7336]|uniref:DUF2808 domain-containing protein n=1 Tax=Synechococcus sp. PCC 7336 TaxID=195250 RepID=UPI000370115E|nr:DUF2808 domain-containing protein [Synechococcus sp. PCC 7336]
MSNTNRSPAKRLLVPLAKLAAGAIASIGLAAGVSWGVVFSDGRIAFNSPPRMVDTSLTPKFASARNATFRFALSLPANAGEPLSYVEIIPYSGVETIYFRLNNITAYEGAGLRRGEPVPVVGLPLGGEFDSEDKAEAIGVLFDPPVEPGRTVTIALKSLRNPRRGGSYLYTVTAYPEREVGVGQRLGLASFSFFDRNGDRDRF